MCRTFWSSRGGRWSVARGKDFSWSGIQLYFTVKSLLTRLNGNFGIQANLLSPINSIRSGLHRVSRVFFISPYCHFQQRSKMSWKSSHTLNLKVLVYSLSCWFVNRSIWTTGNNDLSVTWHVQRRKNLASDEKWIWSDGLSKTSFQNVPFFLCHTREVFKNTPVPFRYLQQNDNSWY